MAVFTVYLFAAHVDEGFDNRGVGKGRCVAQLVIKNSNLAQ